MFRLPSDNICFIFVPVMFCLYPFQNWGKFFIFMEWLHTIIVLFQIYEAWETDKIISVELWRNLSLCLIAVAAISLILLGDFRWTIQNFDLASYFHKIRLTVMVVTCILATLVDLVRAPFYLSISLSSLTLFVLLSFLPSLPAFTLTPLCISILLLSVHQAFLYNNNSLSYIFIYCPYLNIFYIFPL